MTILIYIAFTIVSISSMFPNNAFMNAHEYFYYKLRNVTNDGDPVNATNRYFIKELFEETPTELQANFEAYLTVYGGLACVIGSIINVFGTKSFSNSARVIWGHALVVIVFIPTIALTLFDSDSYQQLFFQVTMILISIACFGSLGLIAGGVLGLSSTFPAKYTQAVMVGQSLAGVLATAISIVCQAVTPNVILNGQLYFAFSLIMTIISIGAYLYLNHIAPPQEEIEAERQGLLNDDDDEIVIESQVTNFPPIDEPTAAIEITFPLQETVWTTISNVFATSWMDLLTVSMTLLVTLAVYPGMTSLVRSTTRNPTWNAYFSSVVSFLLYNVIDLIGRSSANSVRLKSRYLLILSLVRIALIPLIAMCNISPRKYTPSLIPYDGIYVMLIIILGASHGFCITNATIGVSLSVAPEYRELAGSITALTGVTAAMFGGIVGVLVLKSL
ncbi:unnamed protein product [Caenorhabditis bovis]|uniref:Uncharacterized protein n=1 Tax=Caenorhabditis bovis TaxID=2654633 RepID=A0A8S1FA20_9PELO|nr:unnamed protein product [Caenorhabditis bovis]